MIKGYAVETEKIEKGEIDFLRDEPEVPQVVETPASILETHFKNARDVPSDINEHIETFYKYGKECDSVVECGVRTCVSTWGFAKGLLENGKEKKLLIGLDLSGHPNIDFAQQVSKDNGIDHRFHAGDDLEFPLNEDEEGFVAEDDDTIVDGKRKKMYDCLFIDSLHVFQQCALECAKFGPHIRKYILFHDTQIDRFTGEFLRWGGEASVMRTAQARGWDPAMIRLGLWPAVCEFIARNKGEWLLEQEFFNNNGLTILRHKDVPSLC